MDQLIISDWQKELMEIGGANPLLQFELSPLGHIDLTRSHPSGLAQLASAKGSSIGNLFREDVGLGRALAAAKRIRRKAERIEKSFGVAACYVAAGLLRSENRGLPILLWRAILMHGHDLEIRLASTPEVNPAVAAVIQKHRPDYRQGDLLALCSNQSDFFPAAVMSLISEYLMGDAQLEKLLVLGNFVPDLLRNQQLTVESEKGVLGYLLAKKLEVIRPGITPITLVLNADPSQQQVLEMAASGKSFAVHTLPGCGYLQTVINLLANLALDGKRALVIAPKKQTLDELAERLSQINLAGLAIRESESWTDVVGAISRNERARPAELSDARNRYQDASSAIKQYLAALTNQDQDLGVSLMDCLVKLAELAALSNPPTNSARLRSELLARIRPVARPLLAEAHRAQLFSFPPSKNPWFGARFARPGELESVLSSVRSLAGDNFRVLSYQISKYLGELDLKVCENTEQWSEQLRLLLGIRQTLDRFLPIIFDHPLADLIAATAPRGESKLSGAQRRRYKKLAKEFIRPGSSVANLHQALVAAKEQRESWERLITTNAPPSVPLGLADIQAKFENISAVLNLLQQHLDPDPDLPLLSRQSFDDLARMLEQLATNTEILSGSEDRKPIVAKLTELGFTNFVRQVSERTPTLEEVRQEFDLSFWQSALESIVQRNPNLLDYSAEKIALLELAFEQAGNRMIEQGLQGVQHTLAEKWKTVISRYPARADKLRSLLKTRALSLREAEAAGGEIWKVLANAVAISPHRLSELGKSESFDTVLILDAASCGVAEAIRALTFGEQVIAFGDPVIAAPENFDTVARVTTEKRPAERLSIFELISSSFATLSISRNWRTSGQVLGKYLNQNFYSSQLVLEPTPAMLFGEQNFESFEVTEGSRAKSNIDGATESLDAEVEQAVQLVIAHARWTPDESLLLVSASRLHAERIEERIAQEVAKQPAIAEFFDAHGRERFECVSMSEMTNRLVDRVIFSLGFGRSEDGRISGSLGDFNSSQAARWMVNQIVSARKRMSVISCYSFRDFASGSLPENQRWLKDLVAPSFLHEATDGTPDPLLADLARRLEKLGLRVTLNFAGRIGLAAAHGRRAMVVDADWSLVGDNLDEQLRLRPGLLGAMGWEYQRVHAFEIFARPQELANRIAQRLGVKLEDRVSLFDEIASEKREHWGDAVDN